MRLRYTVPALSDLSGLLDYIAAHSPENARRVQGRICAVGESEIIIHAIRQQLVIPPACPVPPEPGTKSSPSG